MSSSKGNKPLTAFPIPTKPQDQEGGKGLDSQLDPPAVWTQYEVWDDAGTQPRLVEYEGR